MEKPAKKLKLSRKAIKSLSDAQMGNAAGGTTGFSFTCTITCTCTCWSACQCPSWDNCCWVTSMP